MVVGQPAPERGCCSPRGQVLRPETSAQFNHEMCTGHPGRYVDELLTLAGDALMNCSALIVSSYDTQDLIIRTTGHEAVDFMPKTKGRTLWRHVEQAVTRHACDERPEIKYRARHLVAFAETDPLTGLYNRRYMDRYVREKRGAH